MRPNQTADVWVFGEAEGSQGVRTASMAPAMPPAVKWVANPTGFFSDGMVGLQSRWRGLTRSGSGAHAVAVHGIKSRGDGAGRVEPSCM